MQHIKPHNLFKMWWLFFPCLILKMLSTVLVVSSFHYHFSIIRPILYPSLLHHPSIYPLFIILLFNHYPSSSLSIYTLLSIYLFSFYLSIHYQSPSFTSLQIFSCHQLWGCCCCCKFIRRWQLWFTCCNRRFIRNGGYQLRLTRRSFFQSGNLRLRFDRENTACGLL